jgi:hypothetical protein
LTIEARGKGLPDPPHRPIDLHLLAAQLLHLRAQPVAHLVELARQPRHLVAAHDGHLAAEVALPDPPRGIEHRLRLAAERAQEHRHEDERDGEEHREGGGDEGTGREEAPRRHGAEERKPQVPWPGQVGRRRAHLLPRHLDVLGVTARGQAHVAQPNRRRERAVAGQHGPVAAGDVAHLVQVHRRRGRRGDQRP